MIEIIKPAVDVGFQTNRLDEHRALWGDRLGLRYDHLLKLGGGVHQHRYDLHGAVLKLNSHRDHLDVRPTGFMALTTVSDGEPGRVVSPDGTPITLVGELDDGVKTVVRVEARDATATAIAIETALGADRDGNRCRIGETVLEVVEVPDRAPTVERDGLGLRYLTVQVRDVEAAHGHALAHGLTEGMAPIRLGDTAYICFVRLPDGDWVELSQRASLTGPLPDVDNRA